MTSFANRLETALLNYFAVSAARHVRTLCITVAVECVFVLVCHIDQWSIKSLSITAVVGVIDSGRSWAGEAWQGAEHNVVWVDRTGRRNGHCQPSVDHLRPVDRPHWCPARRQHSAVGRPGTQLAAQRLRQVAAISRRGLMLLVRVFEEELLLSSVGNIASLSSSNYYVAIW